MQGPSVPSKKSISKQTQTHSTIFFGTISIPFRDSTTFLASLGANSTLMVTKVNRYIPNSLRLAIWYWTG